MSCSDRITRITYPKRCCSEKEESKKLVYSGAPLSCVDGQFKSELDNVIKSIDELICEALIKLKSTTTTTTTECLENECWYNGGSAKRRYLCCTSLRLATNVTSQPTGLINGKPYYEDLDFGSYTLSIYWSSSENRWEMFVDTGTFNGLYAVLNSNFIVPVSSPNPWICVADSEVCSEIGDKFTGDYSCVAGCSIGTLTSSKVICFPGNLSCTKIP